MEKYRYTEWKALYAAEAGLNEVGMVVLPTITSDTLILQSGVNYGNDENNIPIGKLVNANEIANTALFIVEDMPSLTGETISVNGGHYMS